jgi:hypothetical protein
MVSSMRPINLANEMCGLMNEVNNMEAQRSFKQSE